MYLVLIEYQLIQQLNLTLRKIDVNYYMYYIYLSVTAKSLVPVQAYLSIENALRQINFTMPWIWSRSPTTTTKFEIDRKPVYTSIHTRLSAFYHRLKPPCSAFIHVLFY